MDGLITVPWVWAQVTPGGANATTPGGAGSLTALSLRRWFASLTLSPPAVTAGSIPDGFWAVLGGIGALVVVVLAVQGPRRALEQLADWKGHLVVWNAATGRVRRSGRLMMIVVGVSVVSWTTAQGFRYATPTGRDDLALLLQDHRLVDVAWSQGALAALTPLRDVVGLSLMFPMLLGVAFVLFQYSTFRWSAVRPDPSIRLQATRWATIGWGVTALYAIYRFIGFVSSGFSDRPLGGCSAVEALIVPLLMVLADGVLVAWVLVELRHSGSRSTEGEVTPRFGGYRDSGGGTDDDRLDVTGVVLAIPAAIVGCALTFPARYVATGVALGSDYLPYTVLADPGTAAWLRWELSSGLMVWQALGLIFAAWLGAAAWSRGGRWETVQRFGRILVNDGSRVVVALGVAGLVAGLLSSVAYLVVLSLPGAPWVLSAADSYAHYATLPVGLILLAALVELGGRSVVVPVMPVAKSKVEDWAELPE